LGFVEGVPDTAGF
ncbi:type IV secretion-system coupling DNA-binding domain protein, partial [Escherichia coli EC1865]